MMMMNSVAEEENGSLNQLKRLLEQRVDELNEAKRVLARLEKEHRNVLKYNEDLQNQVKLLNAKLCLHQQVVKSVTVNAGTQTDLCLIENRLSLAQAASSSSAPAVVAPAATVNGSPHFKNSWISELKDSKTKISDLVRQAAEHNVNINDYVYDERTKTFYSQSTGWYYYPDREVFYDPRSRNYYKFNSKDKVYEFYSSLDENVNKSSSQCPRNTHDRRKSKREKHIEEADAQDSIEIDDAEEGEIGSSSSEVSVIDIESDGDDLSLKGDEVDYSCIRMIVRQSDSLDEGSLVLVSCKGAKIGNDESCEVYITDDCVSKLHAEITYDRNSRTYSIEDSRSDEGTSLNEVVLTAGERCPLKHGDIVRFGDCEFLLHMHEGKDVTCIYCEPGCVQATLKTKSETHTEIVDKSMERRKQLKLLKKKYGLDGFVREVSVPKGYCDRSEKRRQLVGSDNPYEKTAEGTAVDKPLAKVNKGYKLLQKIGWQEGYGLGKSNSGILNPIPVLVRPEKAGLGFNLSETNISSRNIAGDEEDAGQAP